MSDHLYLHLLCIAMSGGKVSKVCNRSSELPLVVTEKGGTKMASDLCKPAWPTAATGTWKS